MPTTEEIQALVSRIPDPDDNGTYANLDQAKVEQMEAVAAQLEKGGRDALLQLIDLLAEPGHGDDVKARFALHLLAVRVTQPGHEQARAEFSQAVASQVGGDRPKGVQSYLVEELQLAGTRTAAGALGKALLDPELCDAAARALVAIHDDAAEALLQALPNVEGANRRSLIAKLGMLRAGRAAAAFRQALEDPDPETRIAAAWGLARIADTSAANAMLRNADAAEGWERVNTTDACLTLAEGLLAAGRKTEAAAIFARLAKTRTEPSEAHIRTAAERGLAGAS